MIHIRSILLSILSKLLSIRFSILFSILCSFLIAASVVGCSQPAKTVSKFEKVTVNQAFENLLYIALYVAKDAGFFKEQGLDVDIQTGGGDAQAFAALTSGKSEFAQGDPAFVAISHEKGWDGRVIGMVVNRAALWGVSLKPDIEPFSDPAGFRGMTVATFPEPNTSYVIQKQLAQRGKLRLGRDTRILQVVFGTEVATLKNGQADIAQMLEPNVSQLEKEGGKVVFSYPDVWGPIAFTGVMTSEEMIKSRPETVQKFANAYEKALVYVHDNADGTAEIAAKRFPSIAPDVIRGAIKRALASQVFPNHLAVDEQAWRKLLQIRIETGDLKRMPEVDLIDNSFAQKATGAGG